MTQHVVKLSRNACAPTSLVCAQELANARLESLAVTLVAADVSLSLLLNSVHYLLLMQVSVLGGACLWPHAALQRAACATGPAPASRQRCHHAIQPCLPHLRQDASWQQ